MGGLTEIEWSELRVTCAKCEVCVTANCKFIKSYPMLASSTGAPAEASSARRGL